MKKACIVIPFYGKLPKYFPLYMQSLWRMNFDVLMVTDLEWVSAKANFHVIRLSLKQVETIAKEKLGVDVRLSHPRRLCDMKPMYGKIFEDYLEGYEYWGFGDCDLIYGLALRDIVSSAIEEKYDVISLRRNWTTGSFCLVRNNQIGQLLYSRADNWRVVASLTRNDFVDFDELGGKWHQQVAAGEMTIEDCCKIADSFTSVVWLSKDVKVYHEECVWESDLKNETVHVHANGVITVNGREVPMVHFVNCKGRRYFVVPKVPSIVPVDYKIKDTGFYLSNMAWACRGIVAPWRKLRAAVESVILNGANHWIKRIFK